MTRSRRLAALLAVIAALLGGAPSSVSAAAPNTLAEGAVSPVTGTTATVFSFSVEYASTAGWGATAVTADLGGAQVPMSLVAGPATTGTWAGASTLPAGTWQVVFRANAEQGPSPVLNGPVLTVTAPATVPERTSTATGNGGGNGVNGVGGGNGPASAPATEVGQGTDEAPPPAPDAAAASTPAPVPPPAPIAPEPIHPAAQPPASVAPVPAGAAAPARSPSMVPDEVAPAAQTASVGPSGGGVIGTTSLELGEDLLMNVLLIGLLGVGAVAVVGSGILLLGRRRRRDDEQETREAEAVAVPIIEQRALRRARVRLEEEPILPALGLDPSHEAPREIVPAEPIPGSARRRRQKGRR